GHVLLAAVRRRGVRHGPDDARQRWRVPVLTGRSEGGGSTMTMPMPEYDDLDATALAELVRSGAVHPRDLVEAAIARADDRDPRLHALVHTQFDRARDDAGRV